MPILGKMFLVLFQTTETWFLPSSGLHVFEEEKLIYKVTA